MNFYTADPHYLDRKIISLCRRPFRDLAEMIEKLTENHNATVGPNDTVIVVGDFATGPKLMLQHLIDQLNGRKILVRGNHDMVRTRLMWMKLGFADCVDLMNVCLDGHTVRIQHMPIPLPQIPSGIDYVICGHIHNLRQTPPRNVCMSVEQCEYRPLSEAEVIRRIRNAKTDYTYQSASDRVPS